MDQANRENFTAAQAADRLIAAHDGDVALLYIFLRRHEGADLEQAAEALCRTMGEMRSASEKLQRMGLLPGAEAPARAAVSPQTPAAQAPLLQRQPPERRLPEYSAEEIARRSREDGAFSVILAEAVKVIGHALSGSDMKLLFGIYDYLALPPEVILVLLNHCAQEFQQRYGERRRPSARAIEKEAYIWANREIMTLEQADEYIAARRDRQSRMGRMKEALHIRDRELTATEQKYISAWLDMGFTEEAAAIAYDRTVTNTGSLRWSYINRIFQSWQDKGLHTGEEILAGDGRRRSAPAAQERGEKIDMDELRSVLEKI